MPWRLAPGALIPRIVALTIFVVSKSPSLASFPYLALQICASYCATIPDTEYMGVQGGSECFCGESGVDFGRYGSADNCDVPCSGKQKQRRVQSAGTGVLYHERVGCFVPGFVLLHSHW